MVEQWTHKPLDVGSNPTLATIILNIRRMDAGLLTSSELPKIANPTLAP